MHFIAFSITLVHITPYTQLYTTCVLVFYCYITSTWIGTSKADEIKLLAPWSPYPTVPPGGLHSSWQSTLLKTMWPMAGRPVLVAAHFSVVYPEPEVKIARVTKAHPYVRGVGLGGLSCCPVLRLLAMNGDQVHMVFSAVTHSFHPCQVLFDQNQVVCVTVWRKSILHLYFY